jgi:hypothetical protein
MLSGRGAGGFALVGAGLDFANTDHACPFECL